MQDPKDLIFKKVEIRGSAELFHPCIQLNTVDPQLYLLIVLLTLLYCNTAVIDPRTPSCMVGNNVLLLDNIWVTTDSNSFIIFFLFCIDLKIKVSEEM